MRSEPDFLQRVVIDDKMWVFENGTEIKTQSSEWHTTISSIKDLNEQIKPENNFHCLFLTLKVLSMRSLYHPSSQYGILHRTD